MRYEAHLYVPSASQASDVSEQAEGLIGESWICGERKVVLKRVVVVGRSVVGKGKGLSRLILRFFYGALFSGCLVAGGKVKQNRPWTAR